MNNPDNESTTPPRTESAADPSAPVAIVGMACRFPGGPDLAAFWRLLSDGKTAVTEGVPGSGVGRVGQVLFPDGPAEWDACRFGAFVDGIDEFDAEFFRISPLEAQLLDPQQRMMLETCWRALEDAGIDPESLAGTRTGVYAGMSNNDYRHLILASRENAEAAAGLYSVTGSSLSPAIGRVSFVLGFEGPAMVVDTACSSSLVAVHQAVAGLHRGDADLALVGGVQAILFGRLSALRAKAGMLSPNGRCKTFDAAADGYVRGEGCGIVVLKRLDEAERDGDRIWAVIRGSAVNQDGMGPGLTVPEGPAQQRAIEDALARAGLAPAEVDYLEAHGTGTRVGDPTELGAAGAVYGRDRDRNRPLLIGSVKTNIGHLESAAGIAGLIKATLALKRGIIPQHLHFESPNPTLDWDRLALKVTAEASSWPDVDRPWRAGVNSFGFSGTNAHVVLESYGTAGTSLTGDVHLAAGSPQPLARLDVRPGETGSVAPRRVRLLPLSGKTEAAVGELAARYLGWLDEHEPTLPTDGSALAAPLSDLAWTASMGRSHFRHRTGVVYGDVPSLRAGLDEVIAEGSHRPAGAEAPKVAFAYTGQASQWIGMGRNIYETEPVARAVLDRCDALLRESRGTSLIDVMFGVSNDGTAEALDDPSWTQPAIYALECALSALWASIGVRPSVVVGHSLGEIAAAQTAGVFTLEEGLGFAARRGDLIAALPEKGAMAVVFASADVVGAAVEEHNASCEGPGLSMAADNGTNQAISGPERDVEAMLGSFDAQNVRTARLRASPAYHSHLVDPALDELEAYFDSVQVAEPEIVVVSSLTGREVESVARLDGTYWRRQAREQVAFSASIETLAGLGVDVVVEIGPHGVLGPMVSLGWPTTDSGAPAVLSSLRRPSRDESIADVEGSFATAVARAYEAGVALDFTGLFRGEERRRIALPGYPFQRRRHWIEAPRRRRGEAGHPLLGVRHESPRGEVDFETELYATDPAWMNDHRVFDHVLAPGAMYGAMAVSVPFVDGARSATVEDLQIRGPLVFPPTRTDDAGPDPVTPGRKVQVVVGASTGRVEIFSRADGEAEWTLHAEGQVSEAATGLAPETADIAELRRGLSERDVAAFYRAKAATGIGLGPSFQSLAAIWSGPGEAVGEVRLPAGVDAMDGGVHPVLLDGCFQVFSAARSHGDADDETPYLPFGWERLTLAGALPEKLFCHVRLKTDAPDDASARETAREVVTGDLDIYDANGLLLGCLQGYTVKRATRAALLAAVEGLDELLYEVVWRDGPLAPAIRPADFLPRPGFVADQSGKFVDYLAAEGVGAETRTELLADLERLSRHYALITLDRLGWQRARGSSVEAEDLRRQLGVPDEHRRLFRRMLEMLAHAGVLEETDAGFDVRVGSTDALPTELGDDAEVFANRMADAYPHGSTEIGLFRRCGGALSEVLRGEADPLTLLFSSGDPSAADLYLKAPVARAANAMLAQAFRTLLAELPDERRLRVLEVGAGTGSATASVLPELPSGRFDYTYTDISAGFFAEAEARFGGEESAIDYRVLDIEKDPVAQGFDAHGYDLLIASNVLHATRYLNETLGHCRDLLAPSGHLVALENLRGQGWLDLTFGQLDGWWRFADDYRPHHALAAPSVWRRALADAGFDGVAFVGVDGSAATEPDRGVIVAQGPSEVTETAGTWVLLGDDVGTGEELANHLAARNQTVVVAGAGVSEDVDIAPVAGVFRVLVELEDRESWRSLFARLPEGVPFDGVVHLPGLVGHGASATTEQLADDTRTAVASALALAQGMDDADAIPAKGIWFVTRGAQVLERERDGELAGAGLWGIGKVLAREVPHWQPRMIDLDPGPASPAIPLADELLAPDAETHIAYRGGRRRVARFVRSNPAARLELPEEPGWLLDADPGGALDKVRVQTEAARALAPDEVRVAVDAVGLNFWDIFRAMGLFQEGLFGEELVGRIVEVGDDVGNVAVGDRVVGLGDGTFGAEAVTRAALVVAAPPGVSTTALATVPSVFVSAALAFEAADLKAGERVLIHAGAGGLGLAAIELARAAGAEVIATASAPKRDFLRSIGVAHVFDSRTTEFGERVLEATRGAGVDVILNSLTGEGFIAASLSCLAEGGRFVELARRDIWTDDEMAAARPDVGYSIIELDVCKRDDPERAGAILGRVVEGIATGELNPLVHSRWPLAETGSAMAFMQSARHIGKIVLTTPPMSGGALRQDRTYLVTGGLGGIGCVVARWLADHGAGVIVLNGRREPDEAAEQVIGELRDQGIRVEVELADVTDPAAVDAMLARMDDSLPALGGVIHSVGVLSDGALSNLSWDRFEQVLWPKVIGAWHLHRATRDKDLDLFVLFSSVTGVLGNAGQANHAAANAFLDQLAGHRRALGLPGQSIAWGAWSGLGEAEEQRERIARQLEAAGTGWMTPQKGLMAFDRLVRQDLTTATVTSVDWPVFADSQEHHPPFLEEMIAETDTDTDEPSAGTVDLLADLGSVPAGEREGRLVAFLQQELKAVLRMPTEPSPAVGFVDLGMDSLMAVEFRNRLNRALAGAYVAPNTVVFDYPDIESLARHLVRELGSDGIADAEPDVRRPRRLAAEIRGEQENDPIAVVGMACRFPGAPDLDAFWRLLDAGVDAVSEGRRDAGPWPGVAGDPTRRGDYRWGGFLDGIDQFDSRFFRILPIEARMMDPRQRLLLEVAWQAVEDAGFDPGELTGSRTGVYAGVGASEYRDLIEASGEEGGYLGTAGSVAAGRLAFALGLTGPAMPVDLACASSLVAVHHASVGLRRGEIDLALVGGANAVLSPGITKFMAELGMLSRRGKCRTFDAGADGFVRGEGCGIVVLKRLADAESDGDRIWGVIRGSAVSHNGVSAGMTVPNGPSQEQAIEEALARAGVDPSSVDYVEAHGVGTSLGDSIEVRAASNVYGCDRPDDRPLLMGTVKTNIGHLEWAAGVAGLIKTIMSMQRGTIPKHLHFDNPNPRVDWDELPVRITSEPTPWPGNGDHPPRAAVSAFGLSGTNAHVVLEGYPSTNTTGGGWVSGRRLPVSEQGIPDSEPREQALEIRQGRLLPLSARSDDALKHMAEGYLDWLDERTASTDQDLPGLLADMAWTAGMGRSHFAHRAGVVFRDVDSLRAGLEAVAVEGRPSPALVEGSKAKVAFAYTGEGDACVGMGRDLYRCEPIVRVVLDRCDELVRNQRGSSLLDVMFGSTGDLDEPAWSALSVWALQSALAALWESVGVRPNVVVGDSLGEIAAGQAAGVFGLDEGLLLVTARDMESAPPDVATAPAKLELVSGDTGRALAADEVLDGAYWQRQRRGSPPFDRCVATLAGLGVEVVVEVGPQGILAPGLAALWPASAAAPSVLVSQQVVVPDRTDPDDAFVTAVAGAYEAGLAVSFRGLFAGEERSRISIPGYPFEHRRHWISPPRRFAVAAG